METKETSKEALNEICNECNRTGDCDKKYGACPNLMKVWRDLEELENYKKIEEKIGINLITLFKAVENGFFYYNSFKNRIAKAESFLSVIDFESSRLIYDQCECFHFEDYGKDWALTKEELE